ncbi:MAG: SET domain-containing protein [Rhodomicrobium sp.]
MEIRDLPISMIMKCGGTNMDPSLTKRVQGRETIMLLVRTILAPSDIEGLGLFAGQNIPKGTIVWKFVPGVDALFDDSEIESLPAVTQNICRRYSYLDPASKKYVLCGDDARFENHSENPNTAGAYPSGEPFGVDIATRDIHEGEEITCDYRSFDAEFSYKFTSSPKNYVSTGTK